MSDLLPWLALAVWCAALALRVHPRTRRWAPRGIAGRAARRRSEPSGGTPARSMSGLGEPAPFPTLPIPGPAPRHLADRRKVAR